MIRTKKKGRINKALKIRLGVGNRRLSFFNEKVCAVRFRASKTSNINKLLY